MVRALRVALSLVITGAVAFGASLMFLQVAGTLIFRDASPLVAVLLGGAAAAAFAGVAVLLLRAAQRWLASPGRRPPPR